MSDTPEDPIIITEDMIVKPTADEYAKGLADLEAYLPYWTETPAMLIIKPDLVLIVSVTEAAQDSMGFALALSVRQKLMAPASFDETDLSIGCVWNQPYMSFDRTEIHAPYSFTLYFGEHGVKRAQELANSADPPVDIPSWRACFEVDWSAPG